MAYDAYQVNANSAIYWISDIINPDPAARRNEMKQMISDARIVLNYYSNVVPECKTQIRALVSLVQGSSEMTEQQIRDLLEGVEFPSQCAIARGLILKPVLADRIIVKNEMLTRTQELIEILGTALTDLSTIGGILGIEELLSNT